uniref:Uncharacterized protein n=1 Tax=Glossina austeni TaxID=7395 RepID=A0A1A9VA57_GLOAU
METHPMGNQHQHQIYARSNLNNQHYDEIQIYLGKRKHNLRASKTFKTLNCGLSRGDKHIWGLMLAPARVEYTAHPREWDNLDHFRQTLAISPQNFNPCEGISSIIYLIAAAPGEPGAPIDYDEYGDSSEEIGGTPLHEIPGIRL